ncbi:MAG: EF-hand domain-containing protein, partial [Magnetospirillum sp.]|nr:EF-hand domain-containing protein [Magnetospirillum sp.]
MLQGLGSHGTSSSQFMSNRFKQLDTNADNSVDRNEFIAGAPDDVSSDQAGKLFDKLDSKGKGSLSQDDLASAFQQMASTMQSTLIQAQASQNGSTTSSDGTQTTGSHRHHHHDGDGPDAAQMFSKLDANGDGTLTKDEFVAGRPSDVGEDQAGAFYDKIAAASGAESTATGLTKDQLATGLEKTRPDQTGSAQSAAAGSTSSDDQLQALLEQLLSTIQSQLASSGSSSDSAGTSQNGDQGPPDPSKMFAA